MVSNELLFSIIASFCFGISQVIRKIAMTYFGCPSATGMAIIVNGFATIASVIAMLITGNRISLVWNIPNQLLIVSGLFMGIAIVFLNYAIELTQVSLVGLYNGAMFPVFIVLFAWLLLGEKLLANHIVGGIVIIIGIVIISYK